MFRTRPGLWLLVVCLSLAVAAPALAKDKKEKAVPDLTGIWKGTAESVVRTADAPKFQHSDRTLTIEKQDGRGLYGTIVSSQGTESFVGIVDGTTKLYLADGSGLSVVKITGKDTMIVKSVVSGKTTQEASITHYRREDAAAAPATTPQQQ